MSRIGLYQNMIGGGFQIQDQRISPRIASTVEEAQSTARSTGNHSSRNRDNISALREYLTTEEPSDPYSNREIINALGAMGHDVNTGDIAFAREL
jgi:hypothetical protein